MKHHVKEEETEMFPRVRKAKLDLNELGAQMKQRRDELEDEDGPIESGPVPPSARHRAGHHRAVPRGGAESIRFTSVSSGTVSWDRRHGRYWSRGRRRRCGVIL